MQKHVNLVDLVKSFPTTIYLQNLASIQQRTSPLKFDHLAEKSEQGLISNLSTKVATRRLPPSAATGVSESCRLCGGVVFRNAASSDPSATSFALLTGVDVIEFRDAASGVSSIAESACGAVSLLTCATPFS